MKVYRCFFGFRNKIYSVIDTKHAVTIVSADGAEVLLHIGIDTVKLGGKHFTSHVWDG